LLAVFGPSAASTARACDAADCEHAKQSCQSSETQAQAQAAQPQAQAGMRVAIDPETGEYTDAPQAPAQATENMVAPASPPVVEAVPGGGYKLDTSNVQHAFIATANPGGKPKVSCVDQRPTPEN
jgi:hypothetical protein